MSADQQEVKKYGTLLGVFIPSILTILGAIMYLRFGWVVGNAGIWGTMAIAFLGDPAKLATGLDRWGQFVAQGTGVLTAMVWAFGGSFDWIGLDYEAFARGHVANNMITGYRAAAAPIADHQAFASCDGYGARTLYGNSLVLGIVCG